MAGKGNRRCFRNEGQIYYGEVREREDGTCVRHGLGLQIVTAETVTGETVVWGRYQGAWRQDQMTGSGVYRWSDGSVYEGCFVNRQPHGHGRLTWPEGSSYDGDWRTGEMHGQGTFTNGYDKLEVHGFFWRNCIRDHQQKWVDQVKLRESLRLNHLKIGSYPPESVTLPIHRCAPEELLDKVNQVLREPPFLIPLIIAESTCVAGPGVSAAPLGYLEEGKLGCTANTVVHLEYAAREKQRKRNHKPFFRDAIQASLLQSRPFALIWGDEPPNDPYDSFWDAADSEPVPKDWSLANFFEDLVLPLDIFNLQHFHGSGMADGFLPSDKRGLVRREKTEVTEPVEEADETPEGETPEAACPAMLPPPVIHLLRVALVSMQKLPSSVRDEAVRTHVIRRFSACVPLHRICVIVVRDPDAD